MDGESNRCLQEASCVGGKFGWGEKGGQLDHGQRNIRKKDQRRRTPLNSFRDQKDRGSMTEKGK